MTHDPPEISFEFQGIEFLRADQFFWNFRRLWLKMIQKDLTTILNGTFSTFFQTVLQSKIEEDLISTS